MLAIARIAIALVAFVDLLFDLLAVVSLNVDDVLVQWPARQMTGVDRMVVWLYDTLLLKIIRERDG